MQHRDSADQKGCDFDFGIRVLTGQLCVCVCM